MKLSLPPMITNQSKYAIDVLEDAGFIGTKLVLFPMDQDPKLRELKDIFLTILAYMDV